MLDYRTVILLGYINEYCQTGGYKIISEGEMLSVFPSSYKVDGEVLSEIVKFLKENSYITVKYAGGGEYCLMPLPKGRRFSEEQVLKRENEEILQKNTLKYSFLGGFFGSLISVLVGVAIILLC